MAHDWLAANETGLNRHAEGLRAFRRGEFGTAVTSPGDAHRHAVNSLVRAFQQQLRGSAGRLSRAGARARRTGSDDDVDRFLALKERGGRELRWAEQTWDFYYWLFSQRRTPMGRLLLAADRIGLDCYRVVYTSLGVARSIPSPAPFAYIKGDRGPATFRRGIRLPRVGRIRNPFPLIELPYSRLLNPWSLAAIAHEAAHNLEEDLGLVQPVDRSLEEIGRRAGLDNEALKWWRWWQRELFADLCAVLMMGPAAVLSLAEVVAKSRTSVLRFNPKDPHPTPALRIPVCVELLRRMGFATVAEPIDLLWERAYPARLRTSLPSALRSTFPRAGPVVVRALTETRYSELGDRSLREMLFFGERERAMTAEAATRLAKGIDPGVIPERFLVSAAREALDRRLNEPGAIFGHFYSALERR